MIKRTVNQIIASAALMLLSAPQALAAQHAITTSVRASASSSTPYPTTDQTAVTTVYLNSGPISFYQNSDWQEHKAPAISISLPSIVGNYIDIFEGPSTGSGEVASQIQYWAGGSSNSQTQYTISSITTANPPVITTSATPTGITAGSQVFISPGTGSGTIYSDASFGLGGNFYTVASVTGSAITLASGNTTSLNAASASGGKITLVPTTRATAVSPQDGQLVQTSAPQWRLISTVFVGARGVAGQTEQSAARQLIWNADTLNQQQVQTVAFNGIGSVATTNQSPLVIFGGPNSPTASAALPGFTRYDRVASMGGSSNIRTLPTSGTITGDYYVSGNWVQTGAITSNYARIYCAGTMTINNTWTINTENAGGFGATENSGSSFQIAGSPGVGLGAGSNQTGNTQATAAAGGGGGGFGGAGGYSGTGFLANQGKGNTYNISTSLSGSGGAGGGTVTASTTGGNGGAGGGSLYIESVGNISFTSAAALSATGGTGTSGTANSGGGGGSGGGIQIRCLGTVTISTGASITANGGAGANGSSVGGGGGGGGGVIDISGSTVTNSGTCSASGGSAGTGGSTAATAGSTGVVTLNSFIQGPRSAN